MEKWELLNNKALKLARKGLDISSDINRIELEINKSTKTEEKKVLIEKLKKYEKDLENEKKNLEEALKLFLKAFDSENEDTHRITHSISTTYYLLGEYDKSIEWGKNFKIQEPTIVKNIAICYRKKALLESNNYLKKKYFREAFKYYHIIEDLSGGDPRLPKIFQRDFLFTEDDLLYMKECQKESGISEKEEEVIKSESKEFIKKALERKGEDNKRSKEEKMKRITMTKLATAKNKKRKKEVVTEEELIEKALRALHGTRLLHKNIFLLRNTLNLPKVKNNEPRRLKMEEQLKKEKKELEEVKKDLPSILEIFEKAFNTKDENTYYLTSHIVTACLYSGNYDKALKYDKKEYKIHCPALIRNLALVYKEKFKLPSSKNKEFYCKKAIEYFVISDKLSKKKNEFSSMKEELPELNKTDESWLKNQGINKKKRKKITKGAKKFISETLKLLREKEEERRKGYNEAIKKGAGGFCFKEVDIEKPTSDEQLLSPEFPSRRMYPKFMILKSDKNSALSKIPETKKPMPLTEKNLKALQKLKKNWTVFVENAELEKTTDKIR